MTCTEFQKVLPDILEGEPATEQAAHLHHCRDCAELVADLKAICDEARSLAPVSEPSPRVWANIQRALEEEGLVRPVPQPGGVLAVRGWRPWMWWTPVAAALALIVAVSLGPGHQASYRLATQPAVAVSDQSSGSASAPDTDDEQLLAQVSPPMRAAYADNLKSVNAFIRDAQKDVDQNPDDEEARHFLMDAYEQKETLYDLAMNRSMQ